MFSWVLEDLVRSLISYHNVTTCVCIRFYFREVAFDVFYFSLAFLPLTLLLLQQLFYDFWTKQLSLRSRLQILRLSTYSTVNGYLNLFDLQWEVVTLFVRVAHVNGLVIPYRLQILPLHPQSQHLLYSVSITDWVSIGSFMWVGFSASWWTPILSH